MQEPNSYDYAILRVMPHVERGECINVGVILFCRTQSFLGALTHLDVPRMLAFSPDLDLQTVQHQLDMVSLTCKGAPEIGSIALMSFSERFHWLISPRSTIIQASPVHCGLCAEPGTTLQLLFQKLVTISVPSR